MPKKLRFKKLSSLLRVAIDDLRKIERRKNYVVNMVDWYCKHGTVACEVCMAGAVMACRLDIPDSAVSMEPCDFSDDVGRKLQAIDYLRFGHVDYACLVMGLQLPLALAGQIQVAEYRLDRKQFFRDMESLVKTLKRNGL